METLNWRGIVLPENSKFYENSGSVPAGASFRADFSRNFSGTISSSVSRADLGRVDLAPGWFGIEGNFGSLNAKVSVIDLATGKTAATGTVKKGVISFKKKLLAKGAYEIRLESSDRGKSTGSFTLTLTGDTFTRGDNTDDTYAQAVNLGTITAAKTLTSGWVGYGDEVDFSKFTLTSAARLELNLSAAEQTELAIYTLAGGRLKKLKAVTVKSGDKAISGLLLEKGNYYIGVTSRTAKKGGSSDYTVKLTGNSQFFTRGDNTDDTYSQAVNLGSLTGAKTLTSGWVGYGDAVDFSKFSLTSAAKLEFKLSAGDQTELALYTLKNGKLKKLKSMTVKDGGKTLAVLMEKGNYYVGVTSKTAKKGGSSEYTVQVTGNSEFFTKGNTADNNWQNATTLRDGSRVEDWVGYGDAVDYYRYTASRTGYYNVEFTAENNSQAKFSLYQLTPKGKLLKWVSSVPNFSDRFEVVSGTYLLEVRSADNGKGNKNTDYSLKVAYAGRSRSYGSSLSDQPLLA